MPFESEEKLINYAKHLEGLKISDICGLVSQLDDIHRKHTKGIVAKVIETEYFGIPPNSSDKPDFENLGIELKVCPLRYLERTNMYTTKERNVIKMVNYNELASTAGWKKNYVAKKIRRVLFILYLHDNNVPAWNWKVVKAFLWTPSSEQDVAIQTDYELMRKNVLSGTRLREGDHTFFATCPKHGGGYLKDTPLDSPRSSLTEHPMLGMAEKRGFCIKREAFIALIADSIGAPIIRFGRSIGISGDYLEL